MTDDGLHALLHHLVNDTISDEDHARLQERLRSDATARASYRERMDLEASLQTWAAEDGLAGSVMLPPDRTDETDRTDATVWTDPPGPPDRRRGRRKTPWVFWGALLSIVVLVGVTYTVWGLLRDGGHEARPLTAENGGDAATETRGQDAPREIVVAEQNVTVGRLIQQVDCQWQHGPPRGLQHGPKNGLKGEDRFGTGVLKLTAGVAQLQFHSGTNITLESPCTLQIDSADSAQLLAGTVFVDVTDVSNGFLLTTPEASIVDEGTQYAVSLDAESTEVHVFDGSVVWTTADTSSAFGADSSSAFEDRILSGEARRYSRGEPDQPRRIPFGQRQFVRRLEAALRDAAGGQLLAYDGFENLAGRLRRGRSGFGWAGGWESAGRGFGQLAEVVDAPAETVFGSDRRGRRLLLLADNVDMRRRFAEPVDLSAGTLYVSLLLRRSMPVQEPAAVQIVLEPDTESPQYVRRHSVSWGITSAAAPYINNAGRIGEAAFPFPNERTCLLVLRYTATADASQAAVRVYGDGDRVDDTEPAAWTISGVRSTARTSSAGPSFAAIRLSAQGGPWQLDECRVGTSWLSVVEGAVPGE